MGEERMNDLAPVGWYGTSSCVVDVERNYWLETQVCPTKTLETCHLVSSQ